MVRIKEIFCWTPNAILLQEIEGIRERSDECNGERYRENKEC